MTVSHYPPVQAVTQEKHHFFGYYDKFPWNKSGRYLAALEVDFMDHAPGPDEKAVVGIIDTEKDYQWLPLDETVAWNWQQGCMLRWLPSDAQDTIIYNQREDGRLIAMVRNIHSGQIRKLPMPVYAVSHDGAATITTNFARIHRTRPGYGYAGVQDQWADVSHPESDGLYWMNLETGEHKLIISLGQMSEYLPRDDMKHGNHWFNHFEVNPDNTRFTFLHRWQPPEGGWFTRLFTANMDGSDIYLLADADHVSHYDWYTADKVLAWANHRDLGTHYLLYTDHSEDVSILGESVFSVDGHCSYSPDRQWLLTDTYPDSDQKRTLMLYHLESDTRIDIGRFYSPPELTGPIRCDLHPRWSRDGQQVCIDSAHEGSRQLYVIDVSAIVGAN